MTDPNPRIETITPEIAEQYLATMIDTNRPARPNRIGEYAADMKAGKWVLNFSPICFDENGQLIDGQNRLRACILAGVPFRTAVVRGLPVDDAFRTIDTGASRSSKDYLGFLGHKNCALLAASLRQLNKIRHGQPEGSPAYARRCVGDHHLRANRVLTEYLEANEGVVRAVEVVTKNRPAMPPKFCNAGVLVALLTEFTLYSNEQLATDFVESVMTGAGKAMEDKNGPVVLVRNRLMTDALSGGSGWGKSMTRERTAVLIRAWNYSVTGQSAKIIKGTIHDRMPAILSPGNPLNWQSNYPQNPAA